MSGQWCLGEQACLYMWPDCKVFNCLTTKVKALGAFEHWQLLTQKHSVTCQKTWIFSNTAMRTSNPTKTLYLGSTLVHRPLLLAITYILLVSFELNKIVCYCLLSAILHDIISQKTIIFTGTIRTSNLTKLPSLKPVCLWSTSLPLDERTEDKNIWSL